MKKVNRVLIALAVLLVLLTYFEVRLKPQSRPLYERALTLYRQGQYPASLLELERAYQIEPNSTAILVLRGWNYLKLRQYNDARLNFARAARLDPQLTEAQLGLAYVAVETGHGDASLLGIRALLEQDPKNRDFQLGAAVALRQAGNNLEAQKLFEGLLGHSKYEDPARKNLEEMYGTEGLKEKIPSGLPPLKRPGETQIRFRASGRYFQVRSGGNWADFWIKGVNLGPAVPGSFPSEAPNLVETYSQWLQQIAQLGANTIRAYTVLPPAFYRALKRHNVYSGLPRLYLIQQVWLLGPEQNNFFAPDVDREARREIERAIDAVHGQGDLPLRKGYSSGLYVEDVSEYVLALLIGRELEPHLVLANNELNSPRKSYAGKYVSVPEGTATEVWMADMLDHAASYEMQKYNAERPLAFPSWPPLDPLKHPTEATLVEELSFRRKTGERVDPLPEVYDDDDTVGVDETRFRVQPGFEAGLFVSYPVMPYYPEFMLHDPQLLAVKDSAGPNVFFAYLQMLKAHYSQIPLLIAGYGVSTAVGISHLQPQGWNQGGFSESAQGESLARMTRNIAEAGCAGGLLSEWQDEWSRPNWLTLPLEVPADRRPLWLNTLNPQARFGIWTYDPSKRGLFSADLSGWKAVQPLYEKAARPSVLLDDGGDVQRTVRSLSVSSDEEFLYLRLVLQSLPRAPDGTPQFNLGNYLIGISTAPGRFGSRTLPGFAPRVQVSEGVNFLLNIAGVNNTQLLVASNYNPYGLFTPPGSSTRTLINLRRTWSPALENWSSFEEMIVEPNRLRFSRGGTPFPPQRYSRSQLRYGPLDANSPKYDSLATWSADVQSSSLIFRLPWALLFVTDPSSLQVYAGTDSEGRVQSVATEGFAFFVMSYRPGPKPPDWSQPPSVTLAGTDFLPAPDNRLAFSGLRRYAWDQWNTVKVSGRLKESARMLQKTFRELRAP